MPQAALTNEELWKKTLRTTLVMVGSTALWLAALSGAVVLSTGSSTPDKPGSKSEKAERTEKGAMPASSVGPGTPGRIPGAPMGPRMGRHGGPLGPKGEPPKTESPKPGDSI